jgi:putative spermidine/putrescine transport system permease protein
MAGEEAGGSLSAAAALGTSLKVGMIVMAAAVIACVPLAYVLARSQGVLWRMIDTLYGLPLVLPVVVLGLAFLLTAEALGVELGIWRLAIPHMTLAFPFVLRNCLSAMSGIGIDLEEAAQTLGASRFRAFLDIVVPMMRPGIVAGLTFAFIVSFNEFTVTFFMYTIDLGTLPLWMYSRTVSSLDPTVLALSSLIILFDLLVILAIDRLGGNRRDLF